MTPLEERVLAAVRARPGRKAYELAADLKRDARGIDAALRILERFGHVTRREDEAHVVVWDAVDEEPAR